MGLKDPRTYGSGNPGATNVLRTGNKAAAVLTLVFDALKGYVPVLLVALLRRALRPGRRHASRSSGWPPSSVTCGRCSSASKAARASPRRPACCSASTPGSGLATLATWLIIAFFFRYSSLASIVAAVFAPFYQLLIWGGGPVSVSITLISLLLIWRHSANISRLLAGKESRLGAKPDGEPATPVHSQPSHRGHK